MKIAVVGAGNMGGSIIKGAIGAGVVSASDVAIADPSPKQADELRKAGVAVDYTPNNKEAVAGVDIIIVAVKPRMMEDVLGEIADVVERNKQVIVSIAAGVTFAQLSEYLGVQQFGGVGLYRVVPNLAISIGKSVNFIASDNTYAEQDDQVMTLFKALGEVFVIGEDQITAVTALSSSGIAYAMNYINAAAEGGFQMGLDFEESLRIVLETMKGAVALLEENHSMPKKEIGRVATEGGITAKGIAEMERSGFTQAVINGLLATKFD